MSLSPAVGWVIAISTLGWVMLHRSTKDRALQAIPNVVPAPFGLSFLAFLKYLKDGRTPILEGYKKHKGGAMRIPGGVVVTGPQLIEELRRCPDDVMSFIEAVDEDLAGTYTLGHNVVHAGYHVEVIRHDLTRKLPSVISEIVEENREAFGDALKEGDDWISVPVFDMAQQVIAQIVNRIFVGLPICRNKAYLNMMVGYTMHVIGSSFMIKLFPKALHPMAGALVHRFRTTPALRKAEGFLGPMIQERLDKIHEEGKDYADKPNDFTSWLLDNAPPEFATVEDVTSRILAVNFAAIHTSSTTFSHILFNLAKYPHHFQPLREEIEDVINRDGWTKSSLQKLRKLDSFMKETSRMDGIGDLSVPRMAMQDFTFSDGTFIKKGTRVWAGAGAAHYDNEYYPDANEFDGFRFANMREAGEGASDGSNLRHHMVTTSTTYLAFGHGRHACPGRFFAVTEMKVMIAYLILNYDVKLKEGVMPKSSVVGSAVVADTKAHILFRKRRD